MFKKKKIKEKIVFYNPLYNKNSFYYNDDIYIRINNMIKKWSFSLINVVELIINFELEQENMKYDIKKKIQFIKYLKLICNIIIEDEILKKYDIPFYAKSKMSFIKEDVIFKQDSFLHKFRLVLMRNPLTNQYLNQL